MTIEEKLTENQKKKVEYRLNLNYDKELIKSKQNLDRQRFSKNFKTQRDIFLNELFNDGILFFSITVEMPFFHKNEKDMWKIVHLQIEDWVNTFEAQVELIEFCYLCVKTHSKLEAEKILNKNMNEQRKVILDDMTFDSKLPYITGVFGVRSLIGKNETLLNELRKLLNYHHIDCVVKRLFYIKDIKKFWDNCIEDNNFKFHRFVQYSQHYNNLYCEFADLELQYDSKDRIAFQLDEFFSNYSANLKGISDRLPDDQSKINYLISIYMNDRQMYLNSNNLYVKIKKSKFSFFFSIRFIGWKKII